MLPFWCLHTNIYHLCISMVLLFLSDVQAIFLYLGSSRLLFVMLIFIEIEMFQSASMLVVLKKATLQALYSTYVVPNNYNKLRREFCGIFLEEQDQNIALLALPSIFSNLLVLYFCPLPCCETAVGLAMVSMPPLDIQYASIQHIAEQMIIGHIS